MAADIPAAQLLDFYNLVGQLKTTKRTGWVYNHVKDPESVSDHMYRMSLISLTLPDDPVRTQRLMRMSLVHDLAEATVGDIAPSDGVSKEEKRRREMAAMVDIRDRVLCGSAVGQQLFDLWLEYDDGVSADARLMKDIDKFEMIVQADEYERAQGVDLEEFFRSTEGIFTSEIVQQLDKALRERRANRIKSQE